MKNADQAGCRRRFREADGYWDSWDKVAGWILLLAFVLGGTQVLLAQHSQSASTSAQQSPSTQVRAAQSDVQQSTYRGNYENWRAEPSCFDQAVGKAVRAPVLRTWVLKSRDGLFGAYGVNESVADKSSDGEISGCKSTSKLLVTGPQSETAKLVLVMEPMPEVSANSIELVDWSPDGHRLLLSEGYWPWASDAGGSTLRIYDADSGKLSAEDLFEDAFHRYFRRACVVAFDPLGFSRDGNVVVRAYPDLDEEGVLEKDSCLQKVGVWMFNTRTTVIRRVRDDYKVQRYGKRGD